MNNLMCKNKNKKSSTDHHLTRPGMYLSMSDW